MSEPGLGLVIKDVNEIQKIVDVALMLDATASMGDEIRAATETMVSNVQKLKSMYPNCVFRLALVVYRDYDEPDEFVIKDFTTDVESIVTILKGQHAVGGNDIAENVAGALAINAGYRSYDNGIASSESSKNNRNRASASYDLGVAKIGGGYESTSYMYGNTATDTLVSVNVPLSSALNVGAQIGQSSTSGGSTTTNSTQSGSLLVANYSLSKRTYLVGNYYSYSVSGGSQNATGYGLFLYNTF